ncbi:MAG: hypothetical protein IJS40_06330 [Synergistaceae bacterium]|nr:hypothetical protein [Synergistaceae bacterium]
MKKIFALTFAILIFIFLPTISNAADMGALEREALALRVEFNRLGSSGDPFEREAILQKIIDRCKGTEEAVAAYWNLADLYLDGFPEEMRQEAREILEICLKNYPNSPRASMVKCKLVELYDNGDARRSELVRQLQNDKTLPNILRASLK